jgi:hypothetical protein
MKLMSQLKKRGSCAIRPCANSPALVASVSGGTLRSSTSSVTMMANTPSLNASIRPRRSSPWVNRSNSDKT